jgi:cellulose synthase/poly-beta-1,6-N-acetylglucosamine synthase-like glycosyltransferase
MLIFEVIFWVCLFLVVYSNILYPHFLKLLAAVNSNKDSLDYYRESRPEVTFIISAHNEEDVISEKLDNSLAVEYPREKLEIIVISDASDDNTDDIVRNKIKLDHRIRLIRQKQRKGKTAGINLAIKDARGEILIFSDANAIYQKNALYELIKYFKNPQVGYVVGAALYRCAAESSASQSENAYWNLELSLKRLESDFYSVVGGDGAIYAVRKKLFLSLQDDDISDFANPLQVVASGYKGVFNSKAICFEDSADNFAEEYWRKRRIVNRSFRSLLKYIKNFDLIHHRKFLFMLISHKVLRWFGMFFILGIALSALVLALSGEGLSALVLALSGEGLIYSSSLLGIAFSGVLILAGKWLSPIPSCPRFIYLLYYFCLVNFAAMQGILDNFRGIRHVTWKHIKRS